MPRNLDNDIDGQLDLGAVKPILMCSIKFASTTEYVWTGYGSFTWNGQTWKGIGTLGKIENIVETGLIQADGMSVSLSSVDASNVQESLTEVRVGRPFKLYLGFLGETQGVIGDPQLIYVGAVDEPTFTASSTPNGGEIKIAIENKLIDMQRSAPARLTAEEQRRMYPNDAGFDGMAALADTINTLGI